MADNTIIQQGYFTSAGTPKTIELRSDVDWMEIINYTQAATTQATGRGVKFEWQRGMTADTGIEYVKTNNTDALNMVALTSGGFSLVDSSSNPVGALNTTITAVSNAAIPIVSATNTTGLGTTGIVRLINVAGGVQLSGIDFTYDTVVVNTSFRLPYMAQIVAATTGSFRPIAFNPIFYPRSRYITAITRAASAVVTMSVTHGYTVGQVIKFVVPAAYGMTQMDGLSGTVTAINTTTNTVTVNVDSTAFTTFAVPATAVAAAGFTPAQVIPVGEAASSPYENLLDDATYNTSYIGMVLAGGAQSPAGSASDVIYWKAGKSFNL
jgi:hypothetical protein